MIYIFGGVPERNAFGSEPECYLCQCAYKVLLCTGKEIVKFTLAVSVSAKNAAADLKSTCLYLNPGRLAS